MSVPAAGAGVIAVVLLLVLAVTTVVEAGGAGGGRRPGAGAANDVLSKAIGSLSSTGMGVEVVEVAEELLLVVTVTLEGEDDARAVSDKSLRWTVMFRVCEPDTRYGTVSVCLTSSRVLR